MNLKESVEELPDSEVKFPLEKYLSASSDIEEHQILERFSQQLHSIQKSKKSTFINEDNKKSFALSPT